MRTLVDGYPLPEDDPDFEIHLKIDDYLSGPANERSFGATAGRVLAAATSREERYRWMMPLLRRSEWLMEHPEHARPHWASHLMCTVGLLLNHNRQQTEQELLTLLGYCGLFRRYKEFSALNEFIPRAVEAFPKTANKQVWVEALESSCFELEQFEEVHGGRSAAALGLALMFDPAAQHSPSPCWSSSIADLPKMPAAAKWRALFALADTNLLFPQEPKPKQVASAIRKIGAGEFAARFASWIAPLASQASPFISWRGVAILKILLHGAGEAASPELRAPLTALARANWRQPDRAKLALDLLVSAIGRQPQEFARQCSEQLASQPYAAGSAALRVVLSSPQPKAESDGIDGYPLDSRPEHAVYHHRLDDWLRTGPNLMHAHHTAPDLRSLALAGDQPDYLGLLRALLDRFYWFEEKRALIGDTTKLKMILGGRFIELVGTVKTLDRETLELLIKADTQGILYCGGPGQEILDLLERHLETNAFDVDLVTIVESWHKSSHGTIAKQALRRHLGWFLWRETVKPVDLKSCWSARIRQDLRNMPEAQAKLWRDLLSNMTFQISAKPSAKWKKGVARVLETMGTEEFAAQFHCWFKPFGESQPLPLEATGADVLRCLLWAATEVKDPRIDEALAGFPRAQWKSKKSKGHTSKLIGPFVLALAGRPPELVHACLETLVDRGDILADPKNTNFSMYRDLCEQLGRPCHDGIAPPPPPTGSDFLLKNLRSLASAVTDQSVTVEGRVAVYVIDRQTHEIRRKEDNALVSIETSSNSPEAQMVNEMVNLPLPPSANNVKQIQELIRTLRLVRLLTMDQHLSSVLRVTQLKPAIQ